MRTLSLNKVNYLVLIGKYKPEWHLPRPKKEGGKRTVLRTHNPETHPVHNLHYVT